MSVGWNPKIAESLVGAQAAPSGPKRTIEPPAWCVGLASRRWQRGSDGTAWRMVPYADGVLLSARVAADAVIDDDRLTTAATMVYAGFRRRLEQRGGLHPVRFWNFIPSILTPCRAAMRDQSGCGSGPLINRYMRFNVGRFVAIEPWLLSRGCTVAATGVGNAVDGTLVVHCLALGVEGRGLENPEQVPASRYSRRYGPMPPAFARATWLPSLDRLLVSGTASVRGEDSVGRDLSSQLQVTVANLRTIAGDHVTPSAAPWGYESLRAYVRHWDDAPHVRERLASAFPEATEIEAVETDLCRAELLVEVEGLAVPRSKLGRPA